jgi:hypothetical protein
MSAIEYLDRPPTGWFVLSVMRAKRRGWDWTALMIDVDPDDADYQSSVGRKIKQCWVRIAGKHKSHESAFRALDDMMASRH